MTAYYLTGEDRELMREFIRASRLNPGSHPLSTPEPAIHRASDVVIVKTPASPIAARAGSVVSSGTCTVWDVSTWATAGYDITVYNISSSAAIPADSYQTALMDRNGDWHFAGGVGGSTDAIIDIRVVEATKKLQYTKDGSTWIDWHTGKECAEV